MIPKYALFESGKRVPIMFHTKDEATGFEEFYTFDNEHYIFDEDHCYRVFLVKGAFGDIEFEYICEEKVVKIEYFPVPQSLYR